MPASSSAAQIRYLEESIRGVTPSGNPSELRVTGESLNQSVESAASQELRADRMTPDSILTGGQVGGAVNIELSFGTYDTFLEALLAGTFTLVGTNSTAAISDAVFASADNSLSSVSDAIPDANLAVGQWVRIEGTNLNDGVYKLSSTQALAGTKIYFDSAVKTCVNESRACYIETARLKNGTADLRTFSIEKEFTDVSQHFMYRGCGVESASLDFSTGSLLTGSLNFLGQDSDRATATMFPTGLGAVVAATTTPVMNSVQGTTVLLDGTSLGESCAESFSLSIGTGLRGIRCLGSGIGFSDVVVGTFEITATLNIFFGAASSAAVYDKMLLNNPLSFSIAVTDVNGDGYGFNMDRAKLTSSEIVAGGINTDVMMNLGLTATIDTVSDAMISIDRIGSPTVDNPSASPSSSPSSSVSASPSASAS
jgi:hypothetical protein